MPRFVRTNSERKLRIESLECRQLLAADGCVTPTGAMAHAPLDSSPLQAAQNLVADFQASDYRAADSAGNSLRTAANLGMVEGTIQRFGSLSRLDRIDVVRFEITDRSRIRIALDRLTQNADLHVLNRNGVVIGSSTRNGLNVESLSGSLRSGEYFLAITAGSFRSSTYRLTLDVQPIDVSPTPALPVADAPAADSPSTPQQPAAPTTVAPLADVDYFGGSRDWNLNAVGAPEAWAAGYRGQGITVAVIDTGVDLDHPDLLGNLYVNPGEIAGNGIDDDGNGYVDDVSGYDFVDGDARPDDGNGHGTHVAGTIAAKNNGVGATGVAPEANILPVRVLDDQGSGSDFGVAAGIRYAADLGVELINLSLGGGASSRIAEAINYATSLGVLVVAAAGNESAATPSYPARHSAESTGVLSVGAYDLNHQLASFSNAVGSSRSVQVDAPGVSVYNTYAGGGYRSLSGTSMAAPHVSGLAALILSANPQLTSNDVRQLLASGTIGQATGSDSIGKASALNSVAYAAAGLTTAAPSAAGQPTSVGAATIRSASAKVRGSQAINRGGTPRLVVAASPQDRAADDETQRGMFAQAESQWTSERRASKHWRVRSAHNVDAVFASAEFDSQTSEQAAGEAGIDAWLNDSLEFPAARAA